MSASTESIAMYRLKVAAVVTFYMTTALVMVFVNKAVLNSAPDIPFTFLEIQLLITLVLLYALSFASRTVLKGWTPTIELPTFTLQVAKSITPYVLVGVGGLAFNTLCLAYVDAAFFQIARGLLLPFTIAVSAVWLTKWPQPLVVLSAFIVTIGFFIGVSPASYFSSGTTLSSSAISIIYGVISSALLAVHAVLCKKAVTEAGSVLNLAYYGNLMSAIVLLPVILLNGEVSAVVRLIMDNGPEFQVFLYGSAVTGLFGFFMSIASVLSIKVTSPVTHMFSSAARSVIQTMLSVYIFGEIITTQRASSIGVITLGAMFYTWVQSCKPIPRPEAPKDLEAQAAPLPLSPITEKSNLGHNRYRSHGSVDLTTTLASASKESR